MIINRGLCSKVELRKQYSGILCKEDLWDEEILFWD